MSQSAFVLMLLASLGVSACATAASLPPPTTDIPASNSQTATAVFSGGCFWGVEAVFEHVKGVKDAVSGYAGGSKLTAHYEIVGTGMTGHAESVQVTYDPSQITYGKLLQIFFSVAHDPTELNRQGPDDGTQYRSMISYTTEEQKKIAQAYIAQLDQAKVFRSPIVTQVVPFKTFYEAEGYHQNYATLHPNNPYIAINDAPKVEHLKQQLPDLYRDR